MDVQFPESHTADHSSQADSTITNLIYLLQAIAVLLLYRSSLQLFLIMLRKMTLKGPYLNHIFAGRSEHSGLVYYGELLVGFWCMW